MTARRVLPWLAWLALLVQAAIPAGLMPDVTAHEPGLRLVICGGIMPDMNGMKNMTVPMPEKPSDHRKAPACPYAMAMAVAFLYFAVAWLAAALFVPARTIAIPALAKAFTPRRLLGGNSCRGPPR